jgi:hypothetical protein
MSRCLVIGYSGAEKDGHLVYWHLAQCDRCAWSSQGSPDSSVPSIEEAMKKAEILLTSHCEEQHGEDE